MSRRSYRTGLVLVTRGTQVPAGEPTPELLASLAGVGMGLEAAERLVLVRVPPTREEQTDAPAGVAW